MLNRPVFRQPRSVDSGFDCNQNWEISTRKRRAVIPGSELPRNQETQISKAAVFTDCNTVCSKLQFEQHFLYENLLTYLLKVPTYFQRISLKKGAFCDNRWRHSLTLGLKRAYCLLKRQKVCIQRDIQSPSRDLFILQGDLKKNSQFCRSSNND